MILTSMHLLYKKQEETCLECLQRLKNGLEAGVGSAPVSMTYAGRLDPLAAGALLVLEGDEIVEKAAYLALPKTYEFEVVFGIATDTFDQLGIIAPIEDVLEWPTLEFGGTAADDGSGALARLAKEGVAGLAEFDFRQLIGKARQRYPFYSSKPIGGVPLFQYVKDHGIAATIPMLPINEVELYDIETLGETELSALDLARESVGFAERIKGDFRQKEIIESWKAFEERLMRSADGGSMKVLRFRATVGSGFYVRSFACWLGQAVGVGAIARNIVRTKIGDL